MEPATTHLFTPAEVAALFGVTIEDIRTFRTPTRLAKGKRNPRYLAPIRIAGRVLFDAPTLVRFLAHPENNRFRDAVQAALASDDTLDRLEQLIAAQLPSPAQPAPLPSLDPIPTLELDASHDWWPVEHASPSNSIPSQETA